jgi:hypothetical protein
LFDDASEEYMEDQPEEGNSMASSASGKSDEDFITIHCVKCGSRKSSVRGLKMHILLAHLKSGKFKCTRCEVRFFSLNETCQKWITQLLRAFFAFSSLQTSKTPSWLMQNPCIPQQTRRKNILSAINVIPKVTAKSFGSIIGTYQLWRYESNA